MSRVTLKADGRGPPAVPSPASWSRTLIMSTGWTHVVATIPARPPFMKGSAARMAGWCKMPVGAAGAVVVVVDAVLLADMVYSRVGV